MNKNTLGTLPGLLLLIFSFCLSNSSNINARTLYLATDGDDSAACQHGATFRTLKTSVSCLEPGDTLFIKNGTYEGGVEINVKGTSESPVLIRGESLEAIISGSAGERDAIHIYQASHVIMESITVREANRAGASVRFSNNVRISGCRFADNTTWGIFTSFADDIVFENNECCGSKEQHGIYHSNSGDRFVIRDNLIHDNNGCGIHMNGDPEIPGGDGVLNNGLVERNIIFGNGNGGGGSINMTHVHDVIVRSNLAYRNKAGGITVYQDTGTFEQGSKRVLIIGNTVYYEPTKGRSGVNVQTTSEKVVILGNIFVSGGSRGNIEVNSDHLTTIVSDYNILWGVSSESCYERKETLMSLQDWRALTGNDIHSLHTDPVFTDLPSNDFEPASTSPAIDLVMPLDSIKIILDNLGGFEWIQSQLDSLIFLDVRKHRRPAGGALDAGAYEAGSKPLGFNDFDQDGTLGLGDVLELMALSMRNPGNQVFDFNEDGYYSIADIIDLLILVKSGSSLIVQTALVN